MYQILILNDRHDKIVGTVDENGNLADPTVPRVKVFKFEESAERFVEHALSGIVDTNNIKIVFNV